METSNPTESLKPTDELQQQVLKSQSENHTAHAKYFEHVLKILVIAIAFVRFVLRREDILSKLDVDKLEVESPDLYNIPINKDSYADMIYKIPLKNYKSCFANIFLVFEHKSYNDPMVLFQLLNYTVLVLQREVKNQKENPNKPKRSRSKVRLPLTIPIVVYNGKGKFKGPRQLKDLFPKLSDNDKYLLNYEPIIVDLNEIEDEEIPQNPNEMRPYIVIKALKLLCDGFPPDEAAKCIKKVLPYTYDNEELREFTTITLDYFMSVLNNSKNWLEQIIKENQEYEQQQHIDKIQGGTNMLLSIKDQYIKQGYDSGDKHGFERGIEQGIEQGIERSIITNRKTLLKMLTRKFKHVPMDVQENIQSIHDDTFLQTLFIEVLECGSMDEFKKNLL